MKRTATIALAAFAVDSAVQLLASATGNALLGNISKPLLLPLLMVFVLLQVGWTGHPSIKWLVVGQFFSFLGDVALMFSGDLWFALGIGMFLITHICYLIGFFALNARQALTRRPWVLVAYPLLFVAANAALWSGLGPLRLPILVYSAFLVSMAMVSMSLGTLFGIGGTLFMVSDLVIGETVAYGTFPGSDFVVMSTYIIGQALIAWCWVRAVQKTPLAAP
ncbi:MAG: lysoplasmalogenase [Actinomycetes bacterium]